MYIIVKLWNKFIFQCNHTNNGENSFDLLNFELSRFVTSYIVYSSPSVEKLSKLLKLIQRPLSRLEWFLSYFEATTILFRALHYLTRSTGTKVVSATYWHFSLRFPPNRLEGGLYIVGNCFQISALLLVMRH